MSQTTGLFTLDQIGTTRSYTYSEATLISPGRYTARTPMSTAAFCTTFFAHYPALQGMDWSNVAVRGGAVVDILLGRTPADLDFFIYGMETNEGFVRRAGELLEFLLQAERASVEARNAERKKEAEEAAKSCRFNPSGGGFKAASISIKGIRKGCVCSVWSASVKAPVQIVLTSYGSLEAVVQGADMDVCGATFDGQRVLVTAAGRWSLENLAIRVPDGQYPQAARLQKYFDKGFDLVLPGLDVAKLPKNYLRLGLQEAFETPCLTVVYSSVARNKISVVSFLKTEQPPPSGGDGSGGAAAGGAEEGGAEEEEEDGLSGRGLAAAAAAGYGDDGDGGDGDGGGRMTFSGTPDGKAVLYRNMERLVEASVLEGEAPPPDFAVFAEADYVGRLLQPWPELTGRQVENVLEGVRHRVVPSGSGSLNFGVFRQYVRVTPLKALLGGLAAGPEAEANLFSACSKAVAEAVERQKAACNAVLPKLQAFFDGKLPPVLTPEQTFKHKLVTKRELFYGVYAKAPAGEPPAAATAAATGGGQ